MAGGVTGNVPVPWPGAARAGHTENLSASLCPVRSDPADVELVPEPPRPIPAGSSDFTKRIRGPQSRSR